MPSVVIGTYASSSSVYTTLTTAIKTYADGYVSIFEKYTPPNGSLAEQFSRNNGTPLSAFDLTWSYASFLTAVARRSGQMAASWGEPTANSVPSICSATSAQGTYTTPTATAPLPPCTTVSSVAITFNAVESTTFGETVLLAGSISQLGSWNMAKAVPLSAIDYRSEYPRWFVTVTLPAGTTFQYKFIKQESSGSITYEVRGFGVLVIAYFNPLLSALRHVLGVDAGRICPRMPRDLQPLLEQETLTLISSTGRGE